MYGMTNYGNLFADEFTNWLIEKAGFNQTKCQMFVHHKYAQDGSNLVVLSYVYGYVYLYTYEELGKWFVVTLVKRLHMNFLGCLHWFMSIIISQLNYQYISVDQDRYATFFLANYIDISKIKGNSKFRKTNLPHDIIF